MTESEVLEKTEGRIRAIEAIISQMPEFNDYVIAEARKILQADGKSQQGQWADLGQKLGALADEDGEKSLEKISNMRPKKM